MSGTHPCRLGAAVPRLPGLLHPTQFYIVYRPGLGQTPYTFSMPPSPPGSLPEPDLRFGEGRYYKTVRPFLNPVSIPLCSGTTSLAPYPTIVQHCLHPNTYDKWTKFVNSLSPLSALLAQVYEYTEYLPCTCQQSLCELLGPQTTRQIQIQIISAFVCPPVAVQKRKRELRIT